MGIKVYVDWDNNGNFTGTNEEISADVIEASWRLGIKKPYQFVADEATAQITVKNDTGKYNPDNSSSIFYGNLLPGRGLKIAYTDERLLVDENGDQLIDENGDLLTTDYEVILWTGAIEKIRPGWDPAAIYTGKLTATIEASSQKRVLQDLTLNLGILIDKRANEILQLILAEIGATYSLEAGITLFARYGDLPNSNAYEDIKDIVTGEQGRFFVDRQARFIFWNRHHILQTTTVAATVSSGGTYKPFKLEHTGINLDLVYNRVRVTCKPRKTQSSVTLWELNTPVDIPAKVGTKDGKIVIEASPFRDADGNEVSAASVAYTADTYTFGSATITLGTASNKVKITLTNTNFYPAQLATLQITGTPKSTKSDLTVEVEDADSIAAYGIQELRFSIPALDTAGQASDMANFELVRRKDPRDTVEMIAFLNVPDGAANAHQLDWMIGTRLTLNLTEIGHNADYIIIGEEHRAGPIDKVHETRYILEPVEANQFWLIEIVGYSEIEETTRVGY